MLEIIEKRKNDNRWILILISVIRWLVKSIGPCSVSLVTRLYLYIKASLNNFRISRQKAAKEKNSLEKKDGGSLNNAYLENWRNLPSNEISPFRWITWNEDVKCLQRARKRERERERRDGWKKDTKQFFTLEKTTSGTWFARSRTNGWRSVDGRSLVDQAGPASRRTKDNENEALGRKGRII